MLNNKAISFGLCVISFFCTLLCMLLSAAGLRKETLTAFLFTLAFVLLGFLFSRIHRKEEAALAAARPRSSGSRARINEAIEALRVLEQDESDVHRADFQQKAMHALMALGDVRVTRRDLAIVATAKAIEAQQLLRESCERSDAPEETAKIRHRAEELAEIAIHEIREMDHSAQA